MPGAPSVRPHRVLIIDDHAAVRRGFALLVEQERDMKVCGEAGDPEEAMRQAKRLHPDLVLVDLGLRDGSGLELIRQLREWRPELPILVVSMHEESIFAERAMRAGAMGYIMKEETPECLIRAIRKVLSGRVYLSESASEELLERIVVGDRAGNDPIHSLSNRELFIFQAIGEGLSSQEIAERLHLSVKTVETYRARIKERLNISSAADLLRHALRWTLDRRSR